MKALLLLIAVAVGALTWSSLSAPATHAGLDPDDWPPLLNCPNVDGSADNTVTLDDILDVAVHFGASYGDDDYALLYDVSGGGGIDLNNDIFGVAFAFGDQCPLVETQVAQAAVAMLAYRDWPTAQAAGYAVNTQYVPQMGIHVSNSNYEAEFDPTRPIGMVYTETEPGSGIPDQLIGAWYVVPVPGVCDVFGIDRTTCGEDEPVGFDGTEDNSDLNVFQRGWHTHTNLCIGADWVIEQGPGGSPENCKAIGGFLNFETYGWMIHLYNFVPNPAGRFLMWNSNVP